MAGRAYTVTICCNDRTGPFVFVQVHAQENDVIAYAVHEVRSRTDVEYILLRRGNAKPSDPVFWDSRLHAIPDKLVDCPAAGSYQHLFEQKMLEIGILKGTMCLHAKRHQYLNPHVQWMWVQYMKSNGEGL
jgi:hypothetical protein